MIFNSCPNDECESLCISGDKEPEAVSVTAIGAGEGDTAGISAVDNDVEKTAGTEAAEKRDKTIPDGLYEKTSEKTSGKPSEKLSKKPLDEPLGLYIHVPFCTSRCPYCDFYSTTSKKDIGEYAAAVKRTICEYAEKAGRKASSLYIGGGTPGALDTPILCDIVKTSVECFGIDGQKEATCEFNPETAKKERFEAVKKAGINRISMGLQSSNGEELRLLGRHHSALDAQNAVFLARESGFDNISLDIMLGLPFQNEKTLGETIDFCASCGADHISSYILKIEPNSVFGKRGIKGMPDDERTGELYLFAVEKLRSHGYIQYEISNFARDGKQGQHNINYWECGQYIGIGPAAHSFFKGRRFFYKRSLKDFLSGAPPVDDGEGGNYEEHIMLGLRLSKGISLKYLGRKFGVGIDGKRLKFIKRLDESGLAVFDGDNLRLTPRGFLVSNAIIAELI